MTIPNDNPVSKAIKASDMANHLDAMIARHGDLPVIQMDHDTGGTLVTPEGAVTFEHDGEEGDVVVIGNKGYDYGAIGVAASVLVADLRAVIRRHGDHPLHHRDADTSELLRYDAQDDDLHVSRTDDEVSIIIASVGYTGH